MENENVIALRKYILSLNINNNTKNKILEEFNKYINTLINFYKKILQNNPETANMYMLINCEKFKKNLDIYIYSNNNPQKHIIYIKNNLSKENEYKIRNDRLAEIYNLIKKGTLNDIFYKEILTCSSKNYNTLCADIRNLASFMGYDNQMFDEEDKNYTDLDIKSPLNINVIS